MQNAELYHVLLLILAAAIDIAANIFLKWSNGFKKPAWGVLSVVFVLAAFGTLSEVVKGIDLSVAYSLWGGIGMIGTLIIGWVMFGQRVNKRGWIGLTFMLMGMAIVKMA